MTDMIRWDPISEMMSLRSEMDRIFENAFRRSPLTWLPAREVAMDVLETDEAWSLMSIITSYIIDHSGVSQDGKAKIRRWRSDRTLGTVEMDDLAVAALRLPRLAVSIDLSRLPPRRRDDFLRRFDQTFRRGGG